MERRYWAVIAACVVVLFGVVYAAYEAGLGVGGGPETTDQSTRMTAVTAAEGGAGQNGSAQDGTAAGQPSGAGGVAGLQDAIRTLENAASPAGTETADIGAPAGAAPAAIETAEGVDVAALREIAESAPALAPTPAPRSPESPPQFDTVRVEPDGSAVLAGRAAPGAIVEVMVDGEPAETVRADGRGEFVALIDAPSNPAGGGVRRIDLASRLEEGAPRVTSEAPVIIAAPGRPAGQGGAEDRAVALRPGPLGVELLQKPSAVRGAGVSIDQVSYGERGVVRVAGRGEPGQTARIYLDNSLEAEARVADDGEWTVELSREIAPALYTLRVDLHEADGGVAGRAETPFERASDDEIALQKGSVIVQPGNNLWKIADHVYGDGARYTLIYRTNKDQIRDPDLIYPGQVLALPEEGAAAAN